MGVLQPKPEGRRPGTLPRCDTQVRQAHCQRALTSSLAPGQQRRGQCTSPSPGARCSLSLLHLISWVRGGAATNSHPCPFEAPLAEDAVPSPGRKDPLEKEMAARSSTLAWRIPGTEEPGGLRSAGSQRDGHNLATTQQPQISPVSPEARVRAPEPLKALAVRDALPSVRLASACSSPRRTSCAVRLALPPLTLRPRKQARP